MLFPLAWIIPAFVCVIKHKNLIDRKAQSELMIRFKCECTSVSCIDIGTQLRSVGEQYYHIYESIIISPLSFNAILLNVFQLVSQQLSDYEFPHYSFIRRLYYVNTDRLGCKLWCGVMRRETASHKASYKFTQKVRRFSHPP